MGEDLIAFFFQRSQVRFLHKNLAVKKGCLFSFTTVRGTKTIMTFEREGEHIEEEALSPSSLFLHHPVNPSEGYFVDSSLEKAFL